MARSKIANFVRKYPDWTAVVAAEVLIVSLWCIYAQKDFWFSEEFVRYVSQFNINDMIVGLRLENNPPLLFVLARAWSFVVGTGDVQLRILSLVPTLVAILAMRRLMVVVADRTTAAIAVALSAVSGMILVQSIELRMYAWVWLWSICAIICTVGLVKGLQRRRNGIGLLVVCALGLLTHYTFIILVAVLGVWFVATRRWRAAGWIVGALSVVSPWYMYSLVPILRDHATTLGVQLTSAPWWNIIRFPLELFVPAVPSEPAIVTFVRACVAITMGGLLLLGIRTRTGWTKRAAVYLVVGAAALTAARLSSAKYATILIPGVVYLVAAGIRALPPLQSRVVGATLVVVMMSLSVAVVRQPFVTYSSAAERIRPTLQNDDVVLVHPYNDAISAQRYLGSTVNVRGFFPGREPGQLSFEDVVRYNFVSVVQPDNIDALSMYVGSARRVWVFYDVSPGAGYWNGNLINEWFHSQGFTSTFLTEMFEGVPPLVALYAKP